MVKLGTNRDFTERILKNSRTFAPISKFRISAEGLSQLICQNHGRFIVLMFDNKWADLIGLKNFESQFGLIGPVSR